MTLLQSDYVERVYAGVLGKIIGVYLGRPFEGWTYHRITRELGDIWYYVHERLGSPLIVTDDDIAGTFTFLRALPDYGNRRDLTPAQVGQTWLNYLVERRTVLWWGGLGNSTEHTAYLRLKHGIMPPESGSRHLNGKVVSEQVGAQIFIDGWAMVAPGDPGLAADFARRASSVAFDGEAIYGAQVLAAMEAQAFLESDLNRLLDCGVSFIPKDSVIYRMISDIREWRDAEPDWRQARQLLEGKYGYDHYGGNCHMVPNHGLIMLSLLYGDDDFQKTQMIVNTGGWDTDCNAGNVGCLMGIKNGLAGLESGADFRGPVADRLYLSTADGGRAITDAAREAYEIANVGRALAGEPPLSPKGGARFHFELPGSVQGFRAEDSPECSGTVEVTNVVGGSRRGERSLALSYRGLALGRTARVATPTFTPREAIQMPGYTLLASPSLYPGQTVQASLSASTRNTHAVTCGLYVRIYGAGDRLEIARGPRANLEPGAEVELTWLLDCPGGAPTAEVGLEIVGERGASGVVHLDWLTWDGEPDVLFTRPGWAGEMWRRAWVDGVDHWQAHYPEPFRLIQDEGTGLLIQGTREWASYRVTADITPHMAKASGIAARVQGMRRYYALLLCNEGLVQLVKALDGYTVLAEARFPWQLDETHELRLEVVNQLIEASVDGHVVFRVEDTDRPLESGAIALVCEEGRMASNAVRVQPARVD
jgi:ADP-ribosylglycohydrolase